MQIIIDSCQVNNGGCDPNAACYHDPKTNAVQCACNTGYTNVGTDSAVVCKGNVHFFPRTVLILSELKNRVQIPAW